MFIVDVEHLTGFVIVENSVCLVYLDMDMGLKLLMVV